MKTFRLDRYFEKDWGPHLEVEKRAVEFYGCLHHSCPGCFHPETKSPFKNVTMESLHRDTLERERELESLGIEIDSIWEYEWDRMLKFDS